MRSAKRSSAHAAPVLLLSANSSWNIVHFRSGLVRGLAREGYKIVVAAPRDAHSPLLEELRTEFVDLPINSSGSSIVEDISLFFRYRQIIRRVRPAAFLGFTVKPNIYGSLAARMAGAKVFNNITGLGTAFIKPGPLTLIVTELYRLALRGSSTVFFQNREDLDFFASKGIVRRDQAAVIPGDGVDLHQFRPLERARASGPLRFLFIGRLLWDKGIGEFVEAARIVGRNRPDVVFQILGPAGVDNRTAVPPDKLAEWRSEGIVDYLGETDDVRPALEQADCVVLPSYREGLPRTLLEGSAMGKPLIATDVPGCREVVMDGETGYLCAARSAEALAGAMHKMLGLSDAERHQMGCDGRLHVERNFSEGLVIAKYLEALSRL